MAIQPSGKVGFDEPYLQTNRLHGRTFGKSPGTDLVEYQTPEESQKTKGYKLWEALIDYYEHNEIRPEDINGKRIMDLINEPFKLWRVARDFNGHGGYIFNGLFDVNYSERKYSGGDSRLNKLLPAGTVILGPVITGAEDGKTSITDLSRVHTPHGPPSIKRRRGVVAGHDGYRVLLLPGTSFGGSGQPSDTRRTKYARLAHVDDRKDARHVSDMLTIRYTGTSLLDKLTFVSFEGVWVDLRSLPYSFEGELLMEDLESLADAMDVPADHELRRTHKRLLEGEGATQGALEAGPGGEDEKGKV